MSHPDRARLLFLCQALPFPPHGGVLIRSYNILRLLAREFDVTALCFYRRETHSSERDIAKSVQALTKFGQVEAFPIPQEQSKARLLADHLRSVARQRAYTLYAYDSWQFEKRLEELVTKNVFDVVHVDSLDLAIYLPSLDLTRVVCAHHNVESRLLRSRADASGGIAGAYMRMQAHLTEVEERRWCPLVACNIAVSAADRDAFRILAPGSEFDVVPNGVDTSFFRPSAEVEEGVVFVGGYSWQPNRDAMDFFCREILELVRVSDVSPTVTWVGRANPETILHYRQKYGITLTGYVPDVRPFVHRAACYIAPLRAGGGTRLKILDAWAMGKAIVSTSVGCEGLDVVDGENILVRDDPKDFADAVKVVLNNPELRRRLAVGGRRTAETKYDWEVIGKSMWPRYRQIAGIDSA